MKSNAFNKLKNFFNYYFSKNKIPDPKLDTPYLIEVNDLYKKFSANGNYVLKGVNLKVGHNEFHIFIGANGAGKTTTIKSIIGAYTKYTGDIFLDGISNRDKKSKQVIGYIPEIANFPINTSTFSYLLNFSMLSGVKKADAKRLINEYAERLGFSHLLKRSPNSFSSGQKKKVLLTQALIHDPKILIMDEPAANLDPSSRYEFFQILKDLQNQGKSIFISSHILAELDNYATHCSILHGGKILYNGPSKIPYSNIEVFPFKMDIFVKYMNNNFPNIQVEILGNKCFIKNNDGIAEIIKNLMKNRIISGYNKQSYMNLQEIYNSLTIDYETKNK